MYPSEGFGGQSLLPAKMLLENEANSDEEFEYASPRSDPRFRPYVVSHFTIVSTHSVATVFSFSCSLCLILFCFRYSKSTQVQQNVLS
mmetsp:Transcript_13657/g.15121  ORF Transcript_13657/g.15121 Transcript_13657/m.15121 type:complete len:88 (+) Transcript_13657:1258-1521(+)